jgi:hypothetical protein
VLKVAKNNYGAVGEKIELQWKQGFFVGQATGAAPGGLDPLQANARADRIFLDMLAAYNQEGRIVSSQRGANYAPAIFEQDQRANKFRKKALEAAMNRLFEAKKIRLDEVGPAYKLRKSLVAMAG